MEYPHGCTCPCRRDSSSGFWNGTALEKKLIYQGSVPIGYFEGGSAVLDSDFMGCSAGKELTLAGVAIRWVDGIADALKNKLEGQRKKGGRVCI